MSMNFVLASFLAHRFPGWGSFQVRLDARNRDLLVFCSTPSLREVILMDVNAIAGLDIGIERFIVVQPRFADLIIDCLPS